MNEKPIIVFDGCCNLCNGAVRFVMKHSVEGTFEFVPSQSEAGERLLNIVGMNRDQLQTLILIKDGKCYQKSDATLEICRELKGLRRGFVLFKVVPRCLRDKPYDIIARKRYHWFGAGDNCRMSVNESKQTQENK